MFPIFASEIGVPLGLLAPVVLGVVLIGVVAAARRKSADIGEDLPLNVLEILGWLLAVGGAIALLFAVSDHLLLIPFVIAYIVAVVVTRRYRDSETRALTSVLAGAAERGISLGQATRAFVDERPAVRSHRMLHLADLLDGGMPLHQAMPRSHLGFSLETTLAARIGRLTGDLGAVLRQSIHHTARMEALTTSLLERLLYLLVLLAGVNGLIAFWVIKIYPGIEEMFAEFGESGSALPEATRIFATAISSSIYSLAVIGAMAVCLFYYLGWLKAELPILRRLWLPWDSSIVLRALATSTRSQHPIPTALGWLQAEHPKRGIRRRVRRVIRYIERGEKWTGSLRAAGLVSAGEAAVLDAAERVGNLPWALDEMADRVLTRATSRFQRLLDILFPLVLFLLGAFVLLISAAQLIPLYQLIERNA